MSGWDVKRKGWFCRLVCALGNHPRIGWDTVTIPDVGLFTRGVCECGKIHPETPNVWATIDRYPIRFNYNKMELF